MKGTILVVEDEVGMREALLEHLSRQYRVVLPASNLAEARGIVAQRSVDAVVLDLHLPDGDGVDFLAEIRSQSPDLPVVIITAYPEVETAVKALRGGACDFLQKPFGLADLDRVLSDVVFERVGVRSPICIGPCESDSNACRGHARIIGVSTVIQQLRESIRLAARVAGMPVLIQGPSGSGKELVASALHFESKRCRKPFVTLNCSALPATLAEAELFGHVRGAFTGATADRPGLFEMAHRGTIFLDEIGDLPLELQPKLLRVLETHEVRRIGGRRDRTIDIRVIAATNRDLDAMVANGTFREDLFYRLAVFRVTIPPLSKRTEDIDPLAKTLLAGICAESGLDVRWIEADALEALSQQPWPGNVRQLRNKLYQAAAMCGGTTVRLSDLGPDVSSSSSAVTGHTSAVETLRDAQLAHISVVYDECGGNKSKAARRLGITRVTLRARLKELGRS